MRTHSLLLSIVVAVTALGCSRASQKPKCEETRAPEPKTQSQLPSTGARIFVGNLQAKIATAKQVAQAEPGVAQHCMALSRALYTMGQYVGDPNQVNAAIGVLSECQTKLSSSDLYLARAAQKQSLHQFEEVRADLARAQELGASAAAVSGIQRELDWNTGNYDTAISAIRENATRNPSVESLSRLALLEHSLGDYNAADAAFELADAAIKNTNALTVAWLYVQRGHHHMEIGEYPLAERFFREAVSRLPEYNAATEHLGEVLALQHKYEESATMYERTLDNSNNPEFMGALASVYESLGRKEEATTLRATARSGFLQLIESYPDAMGWHAAEFFLEQGDPAQALSLLSANAKLRPNSESWLGLAKAQLASGDVAAAKVSIDRALAMPLVSVDLYETAASIAAAGTSGDGDKFTERAAILSEKIRTRYASCAG